MAKSLKSAAKTKTNDLFGAEPKERAPLKVAQRASGAEDAYTAADIEVLEGLEPVRRRPGMYIGGTDEKALHHLFAEVIDNSMDEALAGHATFIEVDVGADGFLTVSDNRRGCSRWRARRPTCSAASRSAGAAIPPCSRASMTCRPRTASTSPAA